MTPLVATQGIDPTVDYKKVLKAFKKDFCCNGTVVEDPELGQVPRRKSPPTSHKQTAGHPEPAPLPRESARPPRARRRYEDLTDKGLFRIEQVIQLQGDQRKNVSTFLIQEGIVKKENVKIHGF